MRMHHLPNVMFFEHHQFSEKCFSEWSVIIFIDRAAARRSCRKQFMGAENLNWKIQQSHNTYARTSALERALSAVMMDYVSVFDTNTRNALNRAPFQSPMWFFLIRFGIYSDRPSIVNTLQSTDWLLTIWTVDQHRFTATFHLSVDILLSASKALRPTLFESENILFQENKIVETFSTWCWTFQATHSNECLAFVRRA